MSPQRYLELVSAYGAEFEKWPEEERNAGRACVLASQQARKARAQALELDGDLNLLRIPEPSEALRARVSAIPTNSPKGNQGALPWPLNSVARAGLALAAAAVLGLVVGSLSQQELSSSATVAQRDSWEELTELAFATHLQEDTWQ